MARTPEPAMTVRDMAGYLNVDEKTVYRLVSRGKLPGFKVAGAWRFLAEGVDAWIEKQKREVGGHLSRRPAAKRGARDGSGCLLRRICTRGTRPC
jgi:excisionase family DNA binding protein